MNPTISARTLANIANGMDPIADYAAVFGLGAYMQVAGELYDELRAK